MVVSISVHLVPGIEWMINFRTKSTLFSFLNLTNPMEEPFQRIQLLIVYLIY